MEQQLQKLSQAILVRGELLKQLEVQCADIQASVEEMKPKPVTPAAQASSSTLPVQASSSRSLATGKLDNLLPARCSKMCSGNDTASQKSALMPDAAPGSPATAALLDVAITSPAPSLGAPRVCADTCIIAVHQLFGEMPPRVDVDHAVVEVTPCTDYALVNTHPYCSLPSVDAAEGSSWNPWHDQLMHQSSGGVVVVLQPWPPPTQEHLNWFNRFDERDQHQVTQTIVQIIDQSTFASASRYDMAADDDNETPLIKRPRIKGKSLEPEPSQPTVSTQAAGPASPQPTHRQTRALTAAQQATDHGDPSAVVTYERGKGYLLEKSPICSFLEPAIDASTCPDVPVGPVAKPMNICSSGGKNRLIEHCKTRKITLATAGRYGVLSIGEPQEPSPCGVVILDFDGTLFINNNDHPGLTAAAEWSHPVVPMYIFDRHILSGYSDTMLELLLLALEDLKLVLKSQGSDLLIGLGSVEDVVLKLVNEVHAGLIFTEEEVEYSARSVLANVESSLSNGSFTWESPPEIVVWSAPLYDYKSLRELSTSHNQFLKEKLSRTTPLAAPTLPALNVELDTGSLPTLKELKGFLKDSTTSEDNWVPPKSTSARSLLQNTLNQRKIKSSATLSVSNEGNIEGITVNAGASGRRIMDSMFASESSLEVRGGTDITLDALAAYLKYLEGTGKANWQELHDKVRLAETRDGASFYTLFGPALQLGVISRRRVYHETIQYERDRNAGFLSPFGYSTPTVTASVDAICSMEWYWLLALKSQACIEGNYPIKIWRWKGYLIQYTSVGHEGPAVLLVHGFGASLQHFRDNIGSIADEGNRVWAITLLGFGKSEKPNVNYTELLWSELLRDFITDIVREPVHLVGNSIGGYICAITAGLWPSLAKSLVLLNSAGSVVPSYSFIPLREKGRTSWLSRLQARLLLLFLRSRAGGILKEYYPTRTKRVDKVLVDEIIRASYDPGAATVIESIFNFNLSIPINFLFDSFGGKILVIQGMKDPLTKSESFVSMLREHCSEVHIRELDAGHAPHDEVPDEVNSLLCEWMKMKETEVKLALEKSKAI